MCRGGCGHGWRSAIEPLARMLRFPLAPRAAALGTIRSTDGLGHAGLYRCELGNDAGAIARIALVRSAILTPAALSDLAHIYDSRTSGGSRLTPLHPLTQRWGASACRSQALTSSSSALARKSVGNSGIYNRPRHAVKETSQFLESRWRWCGRGHGGDRPLTTLSRQLGKSFIGAIRVAVMPSDLRGDLRSSVRVISIC